MQERRLDTRLFPGIPYDIAQPSSTGMIAGRFFRYVVAFFQLAIPIATVLLFWGRGQTTSWPLILTSLYLGIYVVRFLPSSLKSDKRRWLAGQMLTGLLEITLLGLLYLTYSRLGSSYTTVYWWGLYILPVYRMAEVAGARTWLAGIFYSSFWIIIGALIDSNPGVPDAFELLMIGSQLLLLVLATFVPYFLLQGWNLTLSASDYWWHLHSEMTSQDPKWDAAHAVHNVFREGVGNYIKADWGALWLLDADIESDRIEPMLNLVSCLQVKNSGSFWNLLTSRDLEASCGESRVRALGTAWMEAAPQESIVQSDRNLLLGEAVVPMSVPAELRSRLVARISAEDNQRTLGFIDIGFNHRILTDLEWKGIEDRVRLLAFSLAELYDHIHRVRLARLKVSFVEIEREAEDEASLFAFAARALSEYFQRPAAILEVSTITGNIETVSGVMRPAALDWLANQLREKGIPVRDLEDLTCIMGAPDSDQPEYFFIYPLLKHLSAVELIVVSDFALNLRRLDYQALRDVASLLNAMIVRRRATQLLRPDYAHSFSQHATREQLRQLARNVRMETSADVVVIYEFENERPKPPPIYAGELRDPHYLRNKPIVIEDPNPLLRVARAGQPVFTTDVQTSMLAKANGSGLNRHGDPVFVIREGITSSIGLPLKTKSGIVGVIWLNFREPQEFNQADRQRYVELFSQLPVQLEQMQLLASAQILAENSARDALRSGWHHHTINYLVAAGLRIKAAIQSIEDGNAIDALDDLRKVAEILEEAEDESRSAMNAVTIGVEDVLRDHVGNLQDAWNLPEEFSVDGLSVIPESVAKELLYVICEAITNAVKHGKASKVSVQAARTSGMLDLVITDNGTGFDLKRAKYGNGLRGSQAKTRELSGTMHIGSDPDYGTMIALRIPLNDMEKM